MNRFTPSWQSGEMPDDDTTKVLDRYHDLHAHYQQLLRRYEQLEQLLGETFDYLKVTFPVVYQEGQQMRVLRQRKDALLGRQSDE